VVDLAGVSVRRVEGLTGRGDDLKSNIQVGVMHCSVRIGWGGEPKNNKQEF
jgi:hypothetical protein